MHPIAQRLAIHAADARRLFAVHSVVNRSQGQEATRLVGVLRRGGQTAQPVRLKILPKTNSGAHSQPPESRCSGGNESHRSTRKQESYSLKAGIRHRQTKEAATDMFSLQPTRHLTPPPN